MKNRIPPPVLTLITLALMVFVAVRFDGYAFHIDMRFWIGLALLALGLGVLTSAGLGFRRKKTTVNPFRPDKSSHLVVEGLYEYTRNPMYLGMALILFGAEVALGYSPNIFLLIAFILYMTYFQIKPEERALTEIFGENFTNYMNRVRRWL